MKSYRQSIASERGRANLLQEQATKSSSNPKSGSLFFIFFYNGSCLRTHSKDVKILPSWHLKSTASDEREAGLFHHRAKDASGPGFKGAEPAGGAGRSPGAVLCQQGEPADKWQCAQLQPCSTPCTYILSMKKAS